MLVTRLDAILLTADDLPTLELDPVYNNPIRGPIKEPPVVEGFTHSWNGDQPEEDIRVRYWLFDSSDNAQKAADKWRSVIAQAGIKINGKRESAYQPEINSSDIIGDATWRVIDDGQGRSGNSIWFVKNNVLVYVMGGARPGINQLPLTRAVARKIEAKIDAVLSKP